MTKIQSPYYYAWKNNEKRAEMYGRRFNVIARGKMNSALVEFDDGQREIISRNAIRKVNMKTKIKWAQGKSLAENIKNSISPACERVQIAGSVSRETSYVDDIEIVAIPKYILGMGAQLSLLGDPPQPVSALDILIEKLIRDKPDFTRGDKNGAYLKNFRFDYDNEEADFQIALYICRPDNWGYILALRTGPSDFNKKWGTKQRNGGLLPNRYSFSGGMLHKDGKPIPTPEEKDVFALIGGMIPPTERDDWKTHYK